MPSHLSSAGSGGGGSYSLPTASSSVLGGVKVGGGLAIDGSGLLSAAPAAALVKLAEGVCASAQASISFSSIDQTYRSLQLVLQARGTASGNTVNCGLQVNGDSAAHYDNLVIYGYSGATGASDAYGQTSAVIAEILGASAPAAVASTVLLWLPNYAGTTFHKNLLAHSEYLGAATAGGWVWEQRAARWASTAAISSITLSCASGNFAAGTVATLYALT